MKRILSLVLALLMVLSMTACQSAPETAPTEAANATASTEAIELAATQEESVEAKPLIELESIVDQKLQENNAVTVTFDTYDEYEKVIHEMGFFEYIGMRYRYSGGDNSKRLVPKQLTYDGENFRFEFDYILYDENTKKDIFTDNWVLYGTKSNVMEDISGVPTEGLLDSSMLDYCVAFPDYYNDNYQMREYGYFYANAFVTSLAKFFGESQHLYSLVRICNSQPAMPQFPRVLGDETDAKSMVEEWETKKPVTYETVVSDDGYSMEVGEFTLHWGGREESFQFRRGMTLADWASSSLNTGSWMAGPEGGIYSQTYEYVVFNSNRDIEELLTDGSHIYAIDNNPDMTGRNINPGMVNNIMTNPSPDVAYAHLVNWQTPLLASGISIVEEGQNPSAYRMFDISTVTAKDANVSVYLRNIDAEIAADMELYVVKDYEQILSVLHEYGISRHTAPISMDAAESGISGSTVKVPFEHLDSNVAVANFSPVESNFLLDKDTAFVVTYQGAIVYWVHMPAID